MNMTRSEISNEIFEEYLRGIEFKRRIDLYKTVNEGERLFSGDQWAGLNVKNMPKPVFNIIKRVIQYKISALRSNPTSIMISSDSGKNETSDYDEIGKVLTRLIENIWERLKINSRNYSGLKDAALTGDYIMYFYWDYKIKTGQPFLGDINCETIDNVNYFPANPNSNDIQNQPYIILAFREFTKKLIKEAKENGIPKEEIDLITPDSDNINQSGDMSKIELTGSEKTICLIKFFKDESGKVYSYKVTKNAMIKDKTDTKLTMYPIALMNWEERKNCAHGISEVFGLKPNQLFINKAFAQAMLNAMLFSFPKIIYDNQRVKKPSNTIGGVIPVNGNIGDAIRYLNPPSVSSDLFRLIDLTISYTKEMMGVNDASLGNISNPDNTSAFMAVREASNVPLEGIRMRFYQMIEDMGRILIDFISSYYKMGRLVSYTNDDELVETTIDFSKIRDLMLNLKVDVGPSSQISEITSVTTLDRLLGAEKITFLQYLERIPDGYIPSKEKLVEELRLKSRELKEQELQKGEQNE